MISGSANRLYRKPSTSSLFSGPPRFRSKIPTFVSVGASSTDEISSEPNAEGSKVVAAAKGLARRPGAMDAPCREVDGTKHLHEHAHRSSACIDEVTILGGMTRADDVVELFFYLGSLGWLQCSFRSFHQPQQRARGRYQHVF
mmetsp:Transcript_188/g.455  ORF Transcript_188/g.455 Transcript_188/m.455 type:complete len:143 (-) Transcript_188:110-538(-)